MNVDPYHRFLGQLSAGKAEALARTGIYTGKPLNGYRRVPSSPIHLVDEEKQDLIRRLFAMAAEPNTSLRQLADQAQRSGLTTGSGKPMTFKSVYNMLTNPFYAGFIRLNGKVLPGKHEPIVTHALFNKVQKSLRKRAC